MLRTYAAVLGTAALVIAGCGDSSSSSDSKSAAPLTKAQFIAKANGICSDTKKAQQPFSDQADALPRGGDIKLAVPILEGGLKESRKGLARLHDLPSPAQDKAKLDQYYEAVDKLLAAQVKLTAAAKSGDRAEGRRIAGTTDALGSNEEQLADSYGIKECSNAF